MHSEHVVPQKIHKVTRVAWAGVRLLPGTKQSLRSIAIPPAPNGGNLTEAQLSDYVDSLRIPVRLVARRFTFGILLRLDVWGGPDGKQHLGRAGIHRTRDDVRSGSPGKLFSRSLPSIHSYRYYPFDYSTPDGRPRAQ